LVSDICLFRAAKVYNLGEWPILRPKDMLFNVPNRTKNLESYFIGGAEIFNSSNIYCEIDNNIT